MYLLKKVIQLRETSNPDHEKPFLEHLEDLRVMITRIVITLLISMTVCFMFQKQLMEVLRRPVDQVWITQIREKLPQDKETAPRPLDVDVWEKAKALEHAASALDAEQRELFYQNNDPELVFHAKSVALLRAALALPEDKRAAFLASLDAPAELKRQVGALVKTAPSPESDSRGNLRLMSALKPTETFMLSMKLSFFAGIIVAFPLLLMFVLQFVLPGLHANEKRVLWPAMLIGFGLFLGGVFFAYYAVLPRALLFFSEWGGSLGVSNDWRIGEYISFATQFTLLFGLSFELPVVVMVFVKLGLLSYEMMSKTRSYAILAIFVAAAVITPTPDAFTLLLMALPMLLLYEICIWLAWLDRRKNRIAEEQEAREREERLIAAGPADDAEHPVSENPDNHSDPHERGDDGWTVDYDRHESDDLPEKPPQDDTPPDQP
jgi:sec-independent protein translocase protein TatC